MKLLHTPADILRRYLVGLPEANLYLPSWKGTTLTPAPTGPYWPAFATYLPDTQNQAVCFYDTMGIKDGRNMETGHVLFHPGVQLYCRGVDNVVGVTQVIENLAHIIDEIKMQSVTVEVGEDVTPAVYLIWSLSRMSNPFQIRREAGAAVAVEENIQLGYRIYVCNFRMTVERTA